MKSAADALAAYDELYRSPVSGEYIIDGDEAQVAADLAAVVREQQEAINEYLQQSLKRFDAYEQGLEDRPVVDAAVAAVEQFSENYTDAELVEELQQKRRPYVAYDPDTSIPAAAGFDRGRIFEYAEAHKLAVLDVDNTDDEQPR